MQVNTKARYLIQELIRKNGWLEMPAEGTSMYPVIQEGDICRFVSCETENLRKGDIILFHNSTGKLVTHRYQKTDVNDDKRKYWFKGDTNLGFDEPIAKENIVGKLVLIKRDKRIIKAASFSMRSWGKLICRLPVLSGVLRSYLNKQAWKRTANF